MVDGGMTVNKLFLQLQSDLVGITVVPAKIAETTALGVALTAYMAVEPSFRIDQCQLVDDNTTEYRTKISSEERDARYRKWRMAVERSIGWDTSSVPTNNRETIFD